VLSIRNGLSVVLRLQDGLELLIVDGLAAPVDIGDRNFLFRYNTHRACYCR